MHNLVKSTVLGSLTVLSLVGCGEDTPITTSTSSVGSLTAPTLNDTGITNCADATSNIQTCPVATHPRQDAQFGRDSTAADNSDGNAGFSFTKIDEQGISVSAAATSWNCVLDNVTNLTWEVKDTATFRRNSYSYTWYDSSQAERYNGYQSGGTCSTSLSSCDTEAYAEAVNTMTTQVLLGDIDNDGTLDYKTVIGLCGYTNWRLPTREELRTLVDLSNTSNIDTTYFPNVSNPDNNTTEGDWYWTSQSSASNADFAWRINFNNGGDGPEYKYASQLIRLVRDN